MKATLAALGCGAILVIVSCSMAWTTSTAPLLEGVGGPSSEVSVTGAQLVPAANAAGWVALAGILAVIATRSWGRTAVGVILVLAGGLSLQHWSRLLGWLPLAPVSLQSGPLLPRLAFAALALALPSAVWLIWRPVQSRVQRGARPWLVLYALLPLLWALMLAHHLALGMAEAGRLLPVTLAELQPAWDASGWQWSADGHVIAFCQSLVVVIGVLGSIVLLRRLLQLELRHWLWISGLPLLLGIGGRWLVS